MPDLSLTKTLAAAVAVLFIACIVIGRPPPERDRFLPWLRFTPRFAAYGAVSIGLLFVAIAALEHPGLSWTPRRYPLSSWAQDLAMPARTLSWGATFVAISVVLAVLYDWIGERSRTAARGVMLFALILLAGAAWPVLSIPKWCAHIGAPADLPVPSPLAAYRPDCDPVRWLDGWSRDLIPLAPWGMLLATAGIGAGLVGLKRATKRGDEKGRDSACAVIALCGLLAACLSVMEIEKWLVWKVWEETCASFDGNPNLVYIDWEGPDYLPVMPGRGYILLHSPPEPRLDRPLAPPLPAVLLAAGLVAALFGEFHLRGRRVLREPEAESAVPGAT